MIFEQVCVLRHNLYQFLKCTGGPEDRLHLDPVPEKHDIDKRCQFPEEALPHQAKHDGSAVKIRDADRHRNQGHHARGVGTHLPYNPGEEGIPAIEIDNGGKYEGNVRGTGKIKPESQKRLDDR